MVTTSGTTYWYSDSIAVTKRLIETDAFVDMISNMKPWGTDDAMLIKCEIYEGNEYIGTQLIKILYKDI